MKRKFGVFALLLVIFYLLLHPTETLAAASRGLLLWFYTLLPTLLPFLILTSIVNHMLPMSKKAHQIFVLGMGLLCGFPLGARLCADGLKTGRLSLPCAQYLLPLANMVSPAFLLTYIFSAILAVPEQALPLFFCMYLPLLIVGLITRPLYFRSSSLLKSHRRKPASGKVAATALPEASAPQGFSMKLFDDSIFSSFEIITKLGGYMILFSILGMMLQQLPVISSTACGILLMLTEITTGSRMLADLPLEKPVLCLLILPLLQLGGLSFLTQTLSMIRGTGLRLLPYLITKAIIAAMTAFLVHFLFI